MKITEKGVSALVVAVVVGLIIYGVSAFDSNKIKEGFAQLAQDWQEYTSEWGKRLSTPAEPEDSPSPSPYVYHPLSNKQKEYVIALGAIISIFNGENLDQLKSSHNKANLTQLMIDWWNISDRESAIIMLDWLRDSGHREEYRAAKWVFVDNNIQSCAQMQEKGLGYRDERDKLCKDAEIARLHDFTQELESRLGGKSLYAWDYARLINVSRWSYTLGYITEEEAWTYMVLAAQELQKRYDSWEEYGEGYLAGRAYWQQDFEASQAYEVIVGSLTKNDPDTEWNKLDWMTNLD